MVDDGKDEQVGTRGERELARDKRLSQYLLEKFGERLLIGPSLQLLPLSSFLLPATVLISS